MQRGRHRGRAAEAQRGGGAGGGRRSAYAPSYASEPKRSGQRSSPLFTSARERDRERGRQRDRERGSDTERGRDGGCAGSPQTQPSRAAAMKERPGAERLQTHTDTETETDRESPAGQPSQLMWPSGAEAIKTAATLQSSAVALEGRCQQLLERVQTLQEEKSRLHNQVRVCVPVPVPVLLSYSLPLSLSVLLPVSRAVCLPSRWHSSSASTKKRGRVSQQRWRSGGSPRAVQLSS